MTPDEPMSVNKPGISTVANGGVSKAQSIGDVRFYFGGQMINMRDVLQQLGLNANFLSISALNWRDYNVLFGKNGVGIRSENTLVANGVMRERMYLLRSASIGR